MTSTAPAFPKYARDEKIMARKAKREKEDPEYHARMEKLYRKHVLKEPERQSLVQIGAPGNAPLVSIGNETKKSEEREEVGAMGD